MRIVRKANIQEIPEAQALIPLPSFLRGFAKRQYEASVETVSSEEKGVPSWAEATQYNLRHYDQPSRICLPIENLRTVYQGSMETEQELAAKLNQTICRCSNFYPPEVILTLHIDALHSKIRSVVARYRESYRCAFHLGVVDFAQHEKDAAHVCTSASQSSRLIAIEKMATCRPTSILKG